MGPQASTSEKGRDGENEAVTYLIREGWAILERNFRSRRGEIDIIAESSGVLAFIEVKTWSRCGPSELASALGPAKIGRIIETSKIYLAKHRQYISKRIRYDIVFLRPGRGMPLRIEGAFDESR